VKKEKFTAWLLFGVLLFWTPFPRILNADGIPAPSPPAAPETRPDVLVEIFLAPEHKGDLPAIRKELASASVTRLQAQFFRLGNPPENIGIGKNVPAPIARKALGLALEYNRGVRFVLPEFRFFPEQIIIGTSAYDERSQIPITAEDLKGLLDPALTTPQFHELLRHLTGEDKGLPTYLH